MATDSEDGDVIQVKTTNKNPDELQADITATIEALDSKPAKAKPKSEPKVDDEAIKVTVKTMTTKPTARKRITTEDVKKVEAAPVVKHKAKMITPLSEEMPAEEPKVEEAPKVEPAAEPEEAKPATETESTPEPAAEPEPAPEEPKPTPSVAPVAPATADPPAPSDETAAKLSEMGYELQTKEDEKAAAKEAEQQQAKIYDTKQYHLPIKPNRHHRQHTVPPLISFGLIGLVILLSGLVAADMGLVDPGFDLPFDLF